MAKHPNCALSSLKINSLKTPGRYCDGNGLYLVVEPSGAKRWLLRVVVHGRRRDLGLGSTRLVPLAEAREKARHYRKMAREGGDPAAAKRKDQLAIPTFKEGAQRVHAEHSKAWRNSKHNAQWISTLDRYAFPVIGSRRVDQIDASDILRVLGPIWLDRPETARRVRQRLKTVFDWSKVAGFRTDSNPVETVEKALPRQPERRGHFAALEFDKVPEFVRALRAATAGDSAKLALEFLILTAARTNEVITAKWSEIDLTNQVWIIPPARMKARREHRVPLSEAAQSMHDLSGADTLIFPGRHQGRPLSNMALLKLVERLDYDVTVHGFRSAFRDWASERTNFSRDVCEAALAHSVKDKTEAAYRRGDLFEKRRDLMSAWADFVEAKSGMVVPLRQRA
jgi:integrase